MFQIFTAKVTQSNCTKTIHIVFVIRCIQGIVFCKLGYKSHKTVSYRLYLPRSEKATLECDFGGKREIGREIELASAQKWCRKLSGKHAQETRDKAITEGFGVDYYFVHPYPTWERGANENINGLIRQYLPRETSFENLPNDEILLIQIN